MPHIRRRAVALALASVLAACGEGGDSDDREMPRDPSTDVNGTVRPDSNTQTGSSIAPGATATSQGQAGGATVAPAATATTAIPSATATAAGTATPNGRP